MSSGSTRRPVGQKVADRADRPPPPARLAAPAMPRRCGSTVVPRDSRAGVGVGIAGRISPPKAGGRRHAGNWPVDSRQRPYPQPENESPGRTGRATLHVSPGRGTTGTRTGKQRTETPPGRKAGQVARESFPCSLDRHPTPRIPRCLAAPFVISDYFSAPPASA